ncbi:MAG TPA: sugar phosphate isomerase/epimerase family protein [Acidobacteriaceae bacterium]|nr:sugar phosphate isomerase/epimerase family protein [Acidobacteriaceae bacterium]
MASAVARSAWPAAPVQADGRGPFRGTLCLFSKPVPQLGWSELAQSAKQAGFGGIDLTVRPEGHVLPERVTMDLPKAVAAIRAEGMEVPMISTGLVNAADPTAEPIFETASKLGIPYVKPGYYHYRFVNVVDERNRAGRKLRALVAVAEKHQIQIGYHNHTDLIGAALWDIAAEIEPLDPRWCGFYFDLGHASVNLGENGWKVATNLVLPRLKMIGAKDFTWKAQGLHKWHAEPCPMGQGITPWREFLETLALSNFHGPISLQQEFTIPGVTDDQGIALSRAVVPQVMASAKTNLDYLKSLLHAAYQPI